MQAKFALGRLVATPGALAILSPEDLRSAIACHQSGEWGDLCAEDRHANDQALIVGGRILSAYHSPRGVKFWIITESDRSVTTVLLPEEY